VLGERVDSRGGILEERVSGEDLADRRDPVALAAGLINVKDFIAFKKGLSLSIPERAKLGIYARVRAVLHEPTMTMALLGVVVLALLVNTVELLCTADLPALCTAVLTQHALSPLQRYASDALRAAR
jgi:hypothetical protein